MTTAEYLEGILSRCEKATPGPWQQACAVSGHHIVDDQVYQKHSACGPEHPDDDTCGYEYVIADAKFISNSRTDLPRVTLALKMAVEGLQQVLKYCNPQDEEREKLGVEQCVTYEHHRASKAIADIEKILLGKI